MGFYWDCMGFYCDLMGFNGIYGDLMGFTLIFHIVAFTIGINIYIYILTI